MKVVNLLDFKIYFCLIFLAFRQIFVRNESTLDIGESGAIRDV